MQTFIIFALLSQLLLQLAAAQQQSGTRLRTRFDIDPGRIINGTEAVMEGTWHQVSLRRRLNDGYFFGTGHICGGSLIRLNVVLSAAHCFVDQYIYDGTFQSKEDFIVVMGTLDRYNSTNTLTFDIAQLELRVPKFNLSTYDQDIALLFLNGSVPANHPNIRPIAFVDSPVAPGVVCQVTGWGLTELNMNSDVLMTVDVPLISDDDCKHKSDLGESLILPGMICAGYLEQGERDACSGDSGGPLVCLGQLTGIVSWGIKCALPKLPGVYTEVAYYHQWIQQQIEVYEKETGTDSASWALASCLSALLPVWLVSLNL